MDRDLFFYPSLFQLVVQRDGNEERIDLGYAGSRLLERLLLVPGEVVPREELMGFAWPDRVVGQGSLNQQVYSLRRLFCDEKGREIIQTLPRRGYLFNPQYVVERQLIEPASQPATPDSPAVSARPELVPADSAAAAPTAAESHSRWIAVALFIGTLLTGLGTSAWVNDQGKELVTRSIHQANTVLHLMAADAKGLDSLQQNSAALLQRIAALHPGPLKLTLDKLDGYYRLFCQREVAPINWLMLHRSQLDLLDEAQLKQCLS